MADFKMWTRWVLYANLQVSAVNIDSIQVLNEIM